MLEQSGAFDGVQHRKPGRSSSEPKNDSNETHRVSVTAMEKKASFLRQQRLASRSKPRWRQDAKPTKALSAGSPMGW